MIRAEYPPMSDEPMFHYLLTPYEAELLSIFRQMEPDGQALIANIMASQMTTRRELIKPVELRLVKGA